MASVHSFLKDINLENYASLLIGQGYFDEQDIFLLTSEDLDAVHIMDHAERSTILNAVAQIDISTWLTYYKLEEYERYFRKHKITTVNELKKCVMCDDLMDELEVMVPGHRKRLRMAASHICLSANSEDTVTTTRQPVAYGYWGKNDAVPTFTSDFLWVNECKIKSNVTGHDSVELLNCLVDTGSEVVTISENILPELDLEFLQTIKSKGIHKVEEKPLYRGVLLFGNKEIEVDVMPDSYNSIGCNVFQKFSHFINGRNHIWLDSPRPVSSAD
ncbi:uncharacterized protein LOC114516499 [Dendronephthya gigantea]|uniref:uncharacterized protein LOC114516499 n=1 Tax=Dendronephthya gigantea TaxID=151771 RepID=UPI0010692158|nr:uncharacterized protein LOC114516499 [Dendronephthya gigantea]